MNDDETTNVSSLPRISNPPLGVPDTIPSNPPKAARWRLYRNPQAQETAYTYPSGNKREEAWEEKFQLLVEYKNEHGTTRVPHTHPILGPWGYTQRAQYKKRNLSQYRRDRLNSIGFEWKVAMSWEEMYNQWLYYKRQHNGSIDVSQRSLENKKLAYWLVAQRKLYFKGKLSQQRIDLMESIGFKWDPLHEQWMGMYQQEIWNHLCSKVLERRSTTRGMGEQTT